MGFVWLLNEPLIVEIRKYKKVSEKKFKETVWTFKTFLYGTNSSFFETLVDVFSSPYSNIFAEYFFVN